MFDRLEKPNLNRGTVVINAIRKFEVTLSSHSPEIIRTFQAGLEFIDQVTQCAF